MKIPRSLKYRMMRTMCLSAPGAMWRRYTAALLIITLVVSISHASALGVIRSGANYSELITVSGRQLMLSQRIMYFVHELSLQETEETARKLKTAIRLFEDSHIFLTGHPDLSERLRDHYFVDGDIPLDPFSRRFAALATYYMQSSGEEQYNIQRQIAAWGEDPLLASLTEAARLFEAEANANVAAMKRLQMLAFAAAILVIALEALFIFFPAHVAISQAFRRLERRKKALARSLRALRLRNAQLTAARQDLDYAANHDAVTGLFNRRAVLAALSTNLEGISREGGCLGLLKVDLDYFKSVNDSHGHRAGDQVLTVVAARLLETAGPGDVVARVGGDEFLVVVKSATTFQSLEDLAERLVLRLRDPVTTDKAVCQIGASVGMTMTTAHDATRDQLLVEADLALYEAKRAGRCRTSAYSESLHQRIAGRNALLAEITKAFEHDEFEVFLQPQLDVQTMELCGCEMLARWRHPEQGIVAPDAFLEAARDAGLLRYLDLAITEKAMDVLERFRAQGIGLPKVSVNACPETLRDPHYVDWLMNMLRERHLTPQDLCVEILESTLIEGDNDVVLRTVESLTTAGISVMLDDFGTGYATMATLSHLRLSGIKIDRSLIDPLPGDRARSIVAALVALSRNLNMKVVAEGVEAPRHFEAVWALGCDVIQGFGIGRPMDAKDFERWYRDYTTGNRRAVS
jgi:diguanylate cyclase (GGDEF)-like protein